MKQRFAWFSDTHLNLTALPFLKRRFIARLNDANVDGLFLTGDISIGIFLENDLMYLAKKFGKPIYFVLGNHDTHFRHINSVHADVKRICAEHPNLHWMTENDVISLNEDTALVGTEGWYDASIGDHRLLRWTFDWFMTLDFLHMDGMQERLACWREMASRSAVEIAGKLNRAFEAHRTVYVLTHFPPWVDATVTNGNFTERLWVPYNTNAAMGQAIERVMEDHPDKRVIVLCGHTHVPCNLQVSETIDCRVARASYWGRVRPEETIVI